MSSAVINVSKVSSMDTSMFTNNRSKLLKLAEGIKTKKKSSNNKKGVNFKKEPGYANIEHLVFGTYRSKNSPNNLNINTENRTNISPSESVITVNSCDSNSGDALVGVNSRTSTLIQESLSHGPQSIFESQAEERCKINFEGDPVSVEEDFIERTGGYTQANAVLQKFSSPTSVLKSHIPLTSEKIDLLEDDSRNFLQTVEDLFPDPPSTTLCADLCSPRTRQKLIENGYHYQVEHANVTRNKSAESTVHSPPVHLLPQNKYITQEFSADFLTPEMPVAANKNVPSFKKLQVQGTVVTVAPSRLCSNTTQSSTRSKPPRVITNTASKSTNSSTSKLGDMTKDVEKCNIQTYRDKISNASASVRLTNNAKMSGAFKRLSPARSSSIALSNGRYSSPPRAMNADEPFNSTCTNRRQSHLKTKSASNDESTMGTSSHFKELESRALPPPSPPLRFSSQKESDLRQQGVSSSKLAEAYSSSRLRKDFTIPHQEISHSSPSTNVSRSSSCNDRVKDELRSSQSNGQKVSLSSTVPLKKSWFLVEDDKNFSDFHLEKVPDVNEQNIVRPSKFSYDNIDVISTILDEPCVVEKHLQNTETKSLKERNIPKCVRRVKAASSPSFSDNRTDSWVSEGDLRRPWSQICSEQDVERLADGRSCRVGSMATGIDSIEQLRSSITDIASESESASAVSNTPSSSSGSSHGNTFGGRFASMRTPNLRPSEAPAEGVIQKFRKSFSARFYKKVKGESPPLPSNSTISARYASFSSYLNDHLESDNAVIDLSSNDIANFETGKTDSATLFKLGPLVWRSSKEKKGKKLKKLSIAGEILNCDQNENVDKDNFESQNKSGVSAGSTVTLINHPHPNGFPPGISVVSPRLFSRRAHSTSLRSERPKRPLSEQSSSLYGSINLSDVTKNGLPPKIVVRREKKCSNSRWSRERTNLRRSISQPLEIEKLGSMALSHSPGGLSDHEDHYLSSASSDEEIDSESEWNGSYTNKLQKNGNFYFEYSEPVMYAEALWDHVTLDSEELPFKAGELVEVLDKSDSEWWWGIKGNQAGWFPASFVRIRVNQEDADEDCFQKLKNGNVYSPNNRKIPMSTDEIRTKVIMEIFNTEQDYVQHLSDVCEGYLKHVRKRPDMFSDERVNIIFGNVEQVYAFHNLFVTELEQCINRENPHLSEIGSCFIKHKEGFEIYSEFCNNHPQAVNELQQLYPIPKYAQFFEACRLLRGMIDIALDGFLLTPVQRICKYPLQLQELLKYTKTDHLDYHNVEKALKTMGNVAHYINERKRRMEGLEKLAEWQTEVEDWQGCDLLDHSSQLIYSGDVYKVTTAWSREFKLFLFDHQLIICKKDLLKKQSYTYKNRISVDHCEIRDIIDGKDVHSGISLKYAWKVYCAERSKWYTFATRTAEEKNKWMQAFNDERKRVAGDKINGFVVSEKAKKMAAMVIHNKKKPKKPKDKENKDFNRRTSRPEARAITSKSGSLPSNVAFNLNKKKTSSGWFHFGSNKKTKR